MTVTVDTTAFVAGLGSGITTQNDSHFTIGPSANALVVGVPFVGVSSGTSSGFAATWNSVSMTLLASLTAAGNGGDMALFGLRNPSTGNHTLSVTWTGANQIMLSYASFIGVDTSSDANAFKNRTTNTGSGSPTSITITNASGDIAVASSVTGGNFGVGSGTDIGHDNTGNVNSGAGNYSTAVNPTLTYTFTSGTLWGAVGTSVSAGGAGPTHGLKRNSSLSGLGASGPFYHDPLARVSVGWRKVKGLLIPDRKLVLA